MVRAIRAKKPYVAFPAKSRFLLAINRILPTPIADWMVHSMLAKYGRQRS
jgi:hypothetical protein